MKMKKKMMMIDDDDDDVTWITKITSPADPGSVAGVLSLTTESRFIV